VEGFLVEDPSLNNIVRGVKEVALDKRRGSTNYSKLVLGDYLGKS